MGWDTVLFVAVYAGLFLAFLALLIGRLFVRNRNGGHALDALWYVALVLLVCLGLAVAGHNLRVRDLQEQLNGLRDEIDRVRDRIGE